MGKKVVLDTNVFVSALGWKGAPREIFKDCIEGSLELFISAGIFDEIKRVLNYPKFKFSQDEIDEFLDQILEVGNFVETMVKVEIIRDDPSDNKFLECAVAVDADCIISSDKHILKIKTFEGIEFLSPEDFIKAGYI
ncbi:MAG: putative toxin-antitoxin system toxin component, PIN family [Deltaproteobacteria bacterium]|nr:putative toxin-antitoxin system toxin component, PIN family [Deltaproteobacteria bacterium]